MSQHIRLSIDDGVAHLTLARPGRLNAVDADMGAQYRDACVRAVADRAVRAVLITSEGPAFCAGGDVLSMAGAGWTGADVTAAARTIHEGIDALTSSAVPVVAAARGAVAGGGIGLMLAADHVVAGEDLRVAGRYADLALTPDLGVSALLTRAIGERRAMAVLLAGREVDAPTALGWGLVEEVVDDPDARAVAVARAWADGPATALGHAKRLVRASSQRPLADSLDDEAATIGRAFAGGQAQERIAAFAAASAARGAGS